MVTLVIYEHDLLFWTRLSTRGPIWSLEDESIPHPTIKSLHASTDSLSYTLGMYELDHPGGIGSDKSWTRRSTHGPILSLENESIPHPTIKSPHASTHCSVFIGRIL